MSATPANVRETRIAFGYKTETAVNTPNITSDCWSMNVLNDTLASVDLVTEDNAAWIGKINEFPTQTFRSHWNATRAVEKYCSSEFLAHLAVFGLGTSTITTPYTGVYQYVCTPQDPSVNGISMSTFSFIEAIRQGGNAVIDRLLCSCAWEDFTIALASGPGLANSKVSANMIGTGYQIQPSGIVIPAQLTEALLPGASATVSVNGVNYVTSKNMVSLTAGWKNNIRSDSGFFPGSGFQNSSDPTSGQIRGRVEFGDRMPTLSVVARFENGSTELATLQNQSIGSATVTVTGAPIGATPANHQLTLAYANTTFRSAIIGNTDGIVTVSFDVAPLYSTDSGIFTMTVITDVPLIGTAG